MRPVAAALAVVILAGVAGLVLFTGGIRDDAPSPTVPEPTRRPAATATAAGAPTTPPATPPVSPRPTPDPAIVADGVVVPVRSVELAMPMSARVEAVAVKEEDEVFTGELLVRLDQSSRRAAVDVAEAAVERAEAAVDRARLQIEQLPPDASVAQRDAAQADLRLAEAELRVAETTLAEGELALAETELRAPFAGTVASVEVAVGEQAIAGQPIVSLGDLSSWLIQTRNVSELNVVRLAVGDRAEVRFDALPGLVVSGTVEQIQVRGSSQQGSVLFDVFVRPDEHHAELRWNMSATVRIVPGN